MSNYEMKFEKKIIISYQCFYFYQILPFLLIYPNNIFQSRMGNCTNDVYDRRSARRSLSFNNISEAKSPLSFSIKSWPHLQVFDIHEAENCIQRSIDAFLYDGQTFEITLKSASHSESKNMEELKTNYSLKCQIEKKNTCYTVRFPEELQRKYLWKFITNWTDFKPKDIVRMGKTKYKLTKLVHKQQKNVFKSIRLIDQSYQLEIGHSENQINTCRICLCSDETIENPLISPCKCSGSVKYTHLKCLSSWLFDLNIDEREYINIRINKSICQLCKTDITETPEYQKMTDLLLGNASNIPAPYAIFQVFKMDEEKERNYFILCFSGKKLFTIGRSSKADIIDKNDKYISKYNSELMYKDQRLFVKDCNSTHGTFMKINNPIQLYASNLSQSISYRNMVIKASFNPKYEL